MPVEDHLKSGECRFCYRRPPQERCIQEFPVTTKQVDPSVLGCGVSLAPPESQMQPASEVRPTHNLKLMLKQFEV